VPLTDEGGAVPCLCGAVFFVVKARFACAGYFCTTRELGELLFKRHAFQDALWCSVQIRPASVLFFVAGALQKAKPDPIVPPFNRASVVN
jgi:hypothetical protein